MQNRAVNPLTRSASRSVILALFDRCTLRGLPRLSALLAMHDLVVHGLRHISGMAFALAESGRPTRARRFHRSPRTTRKAVLMKRVTLALTFALAPILASVGAQADTLKTVKDRGMLACGVSQGLPGFSSPDDKGNRSEERRVGKECRSRWSPYH